MTIPVVVVIAANETSSVFDKPWAVRLTVSPEPVVVTATGVVEGVPTPVTCIPTVIPVVLAIVTVALLIVVVPLNATGVTAPQFVLTVKTKPCVNDVPRLAMMVSRADWESLRVA